MSTEILRERFMALREDLLDQTETCTDYKDLKGLLALYDIYVYMGDFARRQEDLTAESLNAIDNGDGK